MKWTFIAIGLNVNWNSNLVDRTGQFPWSPEVVIAIELFLYKLGKKYRMKKRGAKDVHYIYSAMWNEEHLFKLFTGLQIVENKRLVYFVDRFIWIWSLWKYKNIILPNLSTILLEFYTYTDQLLEKRNKNWKRDYFLPNLFLFHRLFHQQFRLYFLRSS